MYLDIKDEVKEALDNNLPVVALESTIISHGMPYPQNVEMAKHCEEIIRSYGVVPATIAIINRRIKIGLTDDDLYLLATSKNVAKVSRRDLAKVISTKEILGKIFFYALPFIMIDVFKSAYNFVDMTTLVKTLVHSAGYTTVAAENSMSVISTWGNKLNMIIVSISTGIIISLIPNLTSSSVKGDKKDVHHKINQTLQILLFLSVPMTIGLSFLSQQIGRAHV